MPHRAAVCHKVAGHHRVAGLHKAAVRRRVAGHHKAAGLHRAAVRHRVAGLHKAAGRHRVVGYRQALEEMGQTELPIPAEPEELPMSAEPEELPVSAEEPVPWERRVLPAEKFPPNDATLYHPLGIFAFLSVSFWLLTWLVSHQRYAALLFRLGQCINSKSS